MTHPLAEMAAAFESPHTRIAPMSDNSPANAMELPRYKCHKEVWALKIRSLIFQKDGSALIKPDDTCYAPFAVSKEYAEKHSPEAGGYYVVYKDGYKSWSPASEFEDGYTRIER